ncbi:MAG TPA: CHAT domain-containing protein, partial [Gemmatimonadales bacterium]|nr:CHAT domain-containing protein [Gemmatimonadales bacterium]
SLPEATAVLEFVAAPGAPTTVFVVQRGAIGALALAASDSLADQVARFRALVEGGADAGRLARELGAALVEPVIPLLGSGVRRIVIVPDGVLHRLTFEALRLADGAYVLERYAVGFAPSASVLAALVDRPAGAAQASPVRLLAFGDPRSGSRGSGALRDAAAEGYLAAADAAGGLPRLKGAEREARLVARYAPEADVRLGREATAGFLKQTDLRRYRVLHFASHAIVDDRSLAGTALVLAPSPGENGFVGAGDLAALRLEADLVVLSACSSAGGRVTGGEGVQGLTSSIIQAGARSVVATGWRIRDQDVVPLVDRFYAGLAAGRPVIDALQAAKLEALRGGASPQTWAAFMAIGNPFVTVPLRPAPPRSWWSRIVGGRP